MQYGDRARRVVLLDDRRRCIVPQCGVRSRKLDENGVCPPYLHDYRHDDFTAALKLAMIQHKKPSYLRSKVLR